MSLFRKYFRKNLSSSFPPIPRHSNGYRNCATILSTMNIFIFVHFLFVSKTICMCTLTARITKGGYSLGLLKSVSWAPDKSKVQIIRPRRIFSSSVGSCSRILLPKIPKKRICHFELFLFKLCVCKYFFCFLY